MLNNPLRCPNCNQLIADDKKGNIIIKNSTSINAESEISIVKKCNRCKHKYMLETK